MNTGWRHACVYSREGAFPGDAPGLGIMTPFAHSSNNAAVHQKETLVTETILNVETKEKKLDEDRPQRSSPLKDSLTYGQLVIKPLG